VVFENLAHALGISEVHVLENLKDAAALEELMMRLMPSGKLALVIVRRPCLLTAKRDADLAKASGT
jgi:TPP-dependent indolepyruvate ferredoxin oxidoreductase alpha subunit